MGKTICKITALSALMALTLSGTAIGAPSSGRISTPAEQAVFSGFRSMYDCRTTVRTDSLTGASQEHKKMKGQWGRSGFPINREVFLKNVTIMNNYLKIKVYL